MKKRKDDAPIHSRSLWNYTLSPGWTDDEVFILKLALQKFGIGKWRRIIDSECLPGKNVGQIYLQTQRIMGQQSLGNFVNLHIDIEKVFLDNMKVKGAVRKNNCIINTGDNPIKAERARKVEENRQKYGLSKDYVRAIKLPRKNNSMFKHVHTAEEVEAGKFNTIERIHHLENLKKAVDFKIEYLKNRGEAEYKPTFKLKGIMAPDKVEYCSNQMQRENEEPVVITLKKLGSDGFSVTS